MAHGRPAVTWEDYGEAMPACLASPGVRSLRGWRLPQVNKSVLVKGRLSTESVGAAVAMKSWWNPSSTAAVSCTYPFGSYNPYPKLGLTFGCENFGNIRSALLGGAALNACSKIMGCHSTPICECEHVLVLTVC